MAHDDNILQFKNWAISLGCPLECVPANSVLKNVFRSTQDLLAIQDVMRMVLPRHQMKNIRNNILVDELRKLDERNSIPFKSQPIELQRHLRINNLKDQLSDANRRVSELKLKKDKLLNVLTEKNIKKKQLESQLQSFETRHIFIQTQWDTLNDKILIEREINDRIRNIIPIKSNLPNQDDVIDILMECYRELEYFYAAQDDGHIDPNEGKSFLWDRLQKLFSKVSTDRLWNCIQQTRESNLNELISKVNETCVQSEKGNALRIAITKSYADHVGLHYTKLASIKERTVLNKKYLKQYDDITSTLCEKMNLVNVKPLDHNLIIEYVSSKMSIDYVEEQIRALEKAANDIKVKIMARTPSVDENRLLIESVRHVYSEFKSILLQIHSNIEAHESIPEKITYTKECIMYAIQEVGLPQTPFLPSNGMNSTSLTSFNLSSESVLCSTKLEMEPILRTESTGPFVTEILTCLKIPLENFITLSTDQNIFKLSGNSLLFLNKNEINSQSIPGHLLTNEGIFDVINDQIKWLSILDDRTVDQTPTNNLDIVKVDETNLRLNINKQINKCSEFIDKMFSISSNTIETIDTIEKYYQFLMNCALGKFIPNSKLVNDRCFIEYEQEYLLHYNILRNSRRN